jgi:hypothetical protein
VSHEAAPDGGTIFRIDLPLEDAQAAAGENVCYLAAG